MTKLTVTTFLSVDGVMQAPGGPEEDTSGGFTLGGWTAPLFDEGVGLFIDRIFERSGAFLLGRHTYDVFAWYWPNPTSAEDRESVVYQRLNALPKYVASRTLTKVEWEGSSLLKDDAGDAVRELKETPLPGGRELQVHGSAGLLQTLLAEDLVDEFNLIVFPVLLGPGKRLFGPGTLPGALELVESSTTDAGITLATYR
ncbi:dihydrofolate reductase family protein, partial [Actinomadura adrarensis]